MHRLFNELRYFAQVLYEVVELLMSRFVILRAQDGRGMNRRDDPRREWRFNQLPSLAAYPKILSKKRLCRARAQADQHFGFYSLEFGVEPGTARLNLRIPRFLVDAPLAALSRRPLKMLHYIRDVNFRPLDTCFEQRMVQNLSRWPDKGPASPIFLIPRLLTNHHHHRRRRTFTKNCLRRVLPKIAGSARRSRMGDLSQTCAW